MSLQTKEWSKLAAGAAFLGGIGFLAHRLWRKIDLGRAVFSSGWFSEFGSLWPGQAMSLEIEEVLFRGRSKFQDVLVFKSKTYGTVLVLDGVIQCTERDEFAYQEMMAHVALMSHPTPRRVLVIGGGDGGVLREVVRHADVEEIHICEIDEMVITVSKKYLRQLSVGFDDPRVQVHIQDGAKFLLEKKGQFDVVIVDSSDPVGPAESLYREDFYQLLSDCITPQGIAATQGECMWLHKEVITSVKAAASKHFRHVEYGMISIPTYPSGMIGVMCCSKGNSCAAGPARQVDNAILSQLQYYTPEIHKAAFVLPGFARKMLQ
ncbi:unnamed protein product [Vitrella brassicaformis CCMP3155]|uniref:PABS domain-containing protein n=1 Tax=Vitrella brassicaformis (strain CCMP3155) TaxID=1169540 RepID=A0A0G4F525_VITBC|nr:unnamed protein product [Vitrella brassicaformis CCMP3155]|eukprot:CEM06927.1 unnamed protein product [Vitrella brassicaformis CCMP3155]